MEGKCVFGVCVCVSVHSTACQSPLFFSYNIPTSSSIHRRFISQCNLQPLFVPQPLRDGCVHQVRRVTQTQGDTLRAYYQDDCKNIAARASFAKKPTVVSRTWRAATAQMRTDRWFS